MQTTAQPASMSITNAEAVSHPWYMLISRSVLFLIFQVWIALTLILNGSFMPWRFGIFLPFVLVIGLALKLRPSLLPYFVIAHALLDITTLLVYWMM